MWRTPAPTDTLARDTDTVVFQGSEWFYAFNERLMQLRRSRLDGTEGQIIRVRKLPPHPLALTKAFYDKRSRGTITRRPIRHKPAGREKNWQGRRKPRIIVYPPESLDLQQLTAIHQRLSGDTRVFQFRGTVLERVRALLDAPPRRVLVNHLLPAAGGMTISDTLHITTSASLPERVWLGRSTVSLFLRTDTIERIVKHCPKRQGTASARRWSMYRDGMTVGEYRTVAGPRAPKDLTWDWDHDLIRVLRDGVPITP